MKSPIAILHSLWGRCAGGTEREGLLPLVAIPGGGGQQKTDSHHYVGMAILFPYSLKPAV